MAFALAGQGSTSKDQHVAVGCFIFESVQLNGKCGTENEEQQMRNGKGGTANEEQQMRNSKG